MALDFESLGVKSLLPICCCFFLFLIIIIIICCCLFIH